MCTHGDTHGDRTKRGVLIVKEHCSAHVFVGRYRLFFKVYKLAIKMYL